MRSVVPRSSSLFSNIPQTTSKTTSRAIGFLPFVLSFFATLSSTLAWKITDVDFATKMGVKHIPEAYGVISILLILSGITIAFLRNQRSPESLFIRLQEISWKLFALLWLVELQYDISSIPLGIFSLKVLGHVYSSLTALSFWIMYDPYDPFSRVSKNSYTFLIIAGYLGIASSGVVFNYLSLDGASSFIPIIGSLSFGVWILANFCHPKSTRESSAAQVASHKMVQEQMVQEQEKNPPAMKSKKRLSRSTLFLISGSILLNAIAGSSEYSVIADCETKFFANEGIQSSRALGQFLTIFGLGNLIALISSTIWYSVRLRPLGLLAIGTFALLFVQFSGQITALSPILEALSPSWLSSSIVTAAASLFIVESLYPLVVQSNMMNVLAALPIKTQRQARAIIESSAEAIGLAVSAIVIESTSFLILATVGMCLSICALSGFLLLREKRKRAARQQPQPQRVQSNATKSHTEAQADSGVYAEAPIPNLPLLDRIPQHVREHREQMPDVIAV